MNHRIRLFPAFVLLLPFIGVTSAVAAGADASPKSGVREVVVVFKTHFDIGYTDMAANVVRRYRTSMIDQALAVVDKNRDLPAQRQFVWTIPGWPMTKISEDWDGQTPERKRRILEAFKQGRFVVHALPFTTHTELLEPEDLVRGLGFASRLARDAGLPLPRDAKMTDVPSHAWILPTLLRRAGVDFLHLGCNSACSSPRVPMLFFWEGPDGSRLLTMYSAQGYGTGLAPPADWPYRTWLALIHTGDNHGPPTPEEVKKLLDEAAQKLPGVKVRIGRLSDFADSILAETAEIPVVRGDMPDTWIHGPMCDPAGARLARNVRPAIGAAESLGTLLGAWGVKTPPAADKIAGAYEQSLLYGEHTWGGAQYWITAYGKGTKWSYGDAWKADRAAGRFQRLEDSWAEHTAYIETARDLVMPVLQNDMKALAASVGVEGERIVVFNPLPWKRDGEVAVQTSDENVAALKPVDGGPAVHTDFDGTTLRFIARDVPAMGYRTYVPVQAKFEPPQVTADAKTGVLENRWFKVTLDPVRGAIRSLIDKRTDRELVDPDVRHGFGQYLYERFDADQVAAFVNAYVKIKADWAVNEIGKPAMPPAGKAPYCAASPVCDMISGGAVLTSASLIMDSEPRDGLNHGVSTRVVLHADRPYVDLELTVHKKPADPWPEAGWICLPLKVDSPQFRIGRQGSIIDPVQDIVPGSNRNLMAVYTGVAVVDPQGVGVGVCPLDSPLVSLETPGCWKYMPDCIPTKSTVYFNLFNNQWTTNFRMWNEGTWTWRFRIWAIDHYDAAPALIVPSLEARYPLQVAVATGPGGKLPAAQRGLGLSDQGSLVTAFGPNPDGPGLVFRAWEMAGKSGPCEVCLPPGMNVRSVQPADLRGQPSGQPITVDAGRFTFARAAFAPASFILPAATAPVDGAGHP